MLTQQNLIESVAEAALSTVLKGIDPDTGRAISHKRTAELLNKVADMHPEAIRAEIGRLRKKIALLNDYLPEGAGE